jgi:radical SAM superfamily enzyme YgiQ (UPF0313 family)
LPGFISRIRILIAAKFNHLEKNCNRKRDYLEDVKKIHNKGIAVCAAFVFGGDEDGTDVFASTLDFFLEANIDTLQSTRLTPFPGTPLFDKLKKKGRLLDNDWSHYDFFHVVYQPLSMDKEILHSGTAWVQKQFYSYKNIVKRIKNASRYLRPDTILRVILPINLGYRYKLSSYDAFNLGDSFPASL